MWQQFASLFYRPLAAPDAIDAGDDPAFRIVASDNHPPLIAMQAPVEIMAGASAKGPPKFSVLAYTGGALALSGWSLPVVVDLAGMKFGKSLVANLDHDRTRRVGHVVDTAKTESELTLSGIVSAATEAAREVVESAKQGFVWQASIEANPDRLIEVAAGQSIAVNGQTFDGPLYVASRSTLKGFAFVSHGADDSTRVAIAARAAEQDEFTTSRYSDEEIEEVCAAIREMDEDTEMILAHFHSECERLQEAYLQSQQDRLFNGEFEPYREWSGDNE